MTTRPVLREAIAACRGVAVVYGDGDAAVRALDGVSLEIRPHESVASGASNAVDSGEPDRRCWSSSATGCRSCRIDSGAEPEPPHRMSA